MVMPVNVALCHFLDQDISKQEFLDLMVQALEASHSIDKAVEEMKFQRHPCPRQEVGRVGACHEH